MSKSLAETVNFAEAVKKKAYEKHARQVDTFVKSETAEQKLARSGKMQTAKAIEALSKLSGNVLEGEAKKREQEVQLIQQDLQNITARMIQETREGKKPYESETFLDMPLRLQTKIKDSIGRNGGTRDGEAGFNSLDDFTAGDPAALEAHINKFRKPKEILAAMDAYEVMGYNSAFAVFEDKMRNKGRTVTTAVNQQQISDNYQTGITAIVMAQHQVYQSTLDSGGFKEVMDAYETADERNAFIDQQLKDVVTKSHEGIEKHFKTYGETIGVDVPKPVLKKLTVASLIEAAEATGNPYFIDPTVLGDRFNDKDSLSAFFAAKIKLKDKFDRENRQELQDELDAEKMAGLEARRQLDQVGDNGKPLLNWNTPNLNYIQREVLTANDKSLSLGSVESSTNMRRLEKALLEAIEDGQPLELNGQGLEFIGGQAVKLDKTDLENWIINTDLLNPNDKKTLSSNLDSIFAGLSVKGTFPPTAVSYAQGVLEDSYHKDDAQRMVDRMQPKLNMKWRLMVKQAMQDNKWQPLNDDALEQLSLDFMDWIDTEVSKVKPFNKQGSQGATLDGEPLPDIDNIDNSTASTSESSEKEITLLENDKTFTPKDVVYDGTYETLPTTHKQKWEEIKGDPASVKQWMDAGNPIPNEFMSELRLTKNRQANEIIERLGVNRDKLVDAVFDKLHARHGDGMKLQGDQGFLRGLNISEEEMNLLQEQVVNAVASDFIGNMAARREGTFNKDDQRKFEKYAKEVMADPYKVFDFDDWLEGDMPYNYGGTGADSKDILDLANKLSWFDPEAYDPTGVDRKYK